MTDREKAIVMAHTGICMLAGDKFQIFHGYVEDILGRPVQTIEMGMDSVADEIKEKSREDFITLCREEQQPCEDVISRQAVLNLINADWKYEGLEEDVSSLPPVNPQPKTGRWIADVDRWGDVVTTVNGYRCDKCNAFNSDKDNYCPNCGAKMIEPQESDKCSKCKYHINPDYTRCKECGAERSDKE